MPESDVFMPDGKRFEFWDDGTKYSRVYHVACEDPNASDDGPGTEEQPFKTINRAARVLSPSEKVIVHRGIYRECVRPTRGGEAPDRMIAYEAAEGEDVTVRGSMPWTPEFTHGGDWNFGQPPDGATIWSGALPADWFIGYNPFAARNFSSEYTTFTRDWTDDETHLFMLRRGMVFADGKPLKQVFRPRELGQTEGAFCVEDPGLRIHLRLWNDADPKDVSFEVTVHEQVFAPLEPGLGYIRVSGFNFEHAADGIPVPQRAMVSAARGHHWIIEDNRVRWANACGIDVGNETWHRPRRESSDRSGHHIIRRNRISDCGVCGIAAVDNNFQSLVEDNLIERIGDKNIERIWETAGVKFHFCDTVLIRRNVFRHIRNAPGLWLDYLNRNSRVTRNVFTDIESIQGSMFLEVSHERNIIDHNILWDIRSLKPNEGHAINVDTGEYSVVAHNLIGKVRDGFGVMVHIGQHQRIVARRAGLGRRHKVMNNLFVECPKCILFSRTEENQSDGNLFEERSDPAPFRVQYPAPETMLTLDAWREYYGFDRNTRRARIEADFDADTLVLTLKVEGEVPTCAAVEELHEGTESRPPGPVDLKPGRHEYRLFPLGM